MATERDDDDDDDDDDVDEYIRFEPVVVAVKAVTVATDDDANAQRQKEGDLILLATSILLFYCLLVYLTILYKLFGCTSTVSMILIGLFAILNTTSSQASSNKIFHQRAHQTEARQQKRFSINKKQKQQFTINKAKAPIVSREQNSAFGLVSSNEERRVVSSYQEPELTPKAS